MKAGMKAFGVVAAVALSVGARGGGDDDSAGPTTTTSTTVTSTITTTTSSTTTTAPSRLRPSTEDALRTCAKSMADLAADFSLGDAPRGAFDSMEAQCDAGMVQLETDIGGESALFGMGLALRKDLLAQWQLDVVETGEAQPAESGLTARDAAVRWELEIGEEIDELSEG